MSSDKIVNAVQQYYDEKIQAHGATHRGVDWNSPESQRLRFVQLLKVVDLSKPFTINDYGCGYGALADYLLKQCYPFRYCGFDISARMISVANDLHTPSEQIAFVSQECALTKADYTVASGIFNVKFDAGEAEWTTYVLGTLDRMRELSVRGLGFNLLTRHCDRHLMRADLYYADPAFYVDQCLSRFSRHVTLLHDYPLYEFTVLVRL
ncbi:MAG: SAM-dependent methyltransferase [Acidobacteria bacterium]|nr:MAG: SAM-dependent methyltransferase [Acidobacteriota bacterium]